jgi:hypothetical protein
MGQTKTSQWWKRLLDVAKATTCRSQRAPLSLLDLVLRVFNSCLHSGTIYLTLTKIALILPVDLFHTNSMSGTACFSPRFAAHRSKPAFKEGNI